MLKTNRKSKIQLTCRPSLTKRNHNQSIVVTPKNNPLNPKPFQFFKNLNQNNICSTVESIHSKVNKATTKEQSISSIVINDEKHCFDKFHHISIDWDQTKQTGESQVKTFFKDHKRNISAIDNQNIYDQMIQSIKIECTKKQKQKILNKQKNIKKSSRNQTEVSSIMTEEQTFLNEPNQNQIKSVKYKIEKIQSEVLGLNQFMGSNPKIKQIQSLLTEMLYQYENSQKKSYYNNNFETLLTSKENNSNAASPIKKTSKYNSFYEFKSNIVNKQNQIRKSSITKCITQSSQLCYDYKHQQIMKYPFKQIMNSKKKIN